MLMIRLARRGKTNRPFYRVIVSEKRKDTFADSLELLGTVDPLAQPKAVLLNKERIQYWISKGAQPSPTIHNILVDQGIITAEKIRKTVKKAADKKND
ncbi:MAG: 30S ribosomal protein S16 [Patescibacteria group bacterium]